MRHLRTLVIVFFMVAMSTAFAQSTTSGKSVSRMGVGLDSYNRVTLGYNPLTVKYDIDDVSDDVLHGFTVGYTHGFGVSRKVPLFVELGARLNFATRKDNVDEEMEIEDYGLDLGTVRMSHLHLDVPVSLAYKWTMPNGKVSLTPYAGLALKFNLVMNEKADFGRDIERIEELLGYKIPDKFNYFDKDDVGKDMCWNRVQVGWQVGVGMDYKALYVGVHYGGDFGEVAEDVSTSNWAITLGYNF